LKARKNEIFKKSSQNRKNKAKSVYRVALCGLHKSPLNCPKTCPNNFYRPNTTFGGYFADLWPRICEIGCKLENMKFLKIQPKQAKRGKIGISSGALWAAQISFKLPKNMPK